MADESIGRAREVVRHLRHFEFLDNVLYYDRWQACPAAGFDYENEVNEYVSALRSQLLTGGDTKCVVEGLSKLSDTDFASDVDRGVARYLTRRYDEATKLPVELSAELGRVCAEGQKEWEACYKADDFQAFLPTLRRQFDVQRRVADAIDPNARVYQVLVNRNDPSYSIEELDGFFDRLKQVIPEVLRSSADAWAKVDAGVLLRAEDGRTPEATDALCAAARDALGADSERIVPFKIHHPVTVCMGPADSRASTYEDGAAGLFRTVQAMVHETGHAMYSYSSSPEVVAAGLWGGIDGFMHESQSRFCENHIARTEAFWNKLAPTLRANFPGIADVSVHDLVLAMNKPNPCVNRQAADELTYPLHIIIRYEIERDYFDGVLALEDIEDAWNAKYEEYLGVRPANRQEGVLQDVHWASGCVGYFPSYALGDIYAAQFDHALRAQVPDAYERLAAGDPSGVTGWLAEHVWSHGQTYTAPETLKVATGEDLNVEYYLDYLQGRFQI